ncbi:MAG: hypothetical protein Q8O63_10405 [Hoeflea sp.]|nr:hypothetical protein [Hoeflea sp.]
MTPCRRLVPSCLALAVSLTLCLTLSGCGAVIVAKTVTGAGTLVVDGAVGAVRVTGRAVGVTAGAVAGLGRDADEDTE